MAQTENIIDKLGLSGISDLAAKQLLKALYKVEDEQGYLNESITTIVSYLHTRVQGEKKPTIKFNSRGESGNIYFLMQLVANAINDEEEMKKLWEQVKQGSYDEAIKKIRRKVKLIDLDGLY